jgi:glycosyltransferase involved in cell wall biosynthesis
MPPINMKKAIKVMQKTKISINCTFHILPAGTHERLLMAAMAGSVILSNYNPVFKKTFEEDAILTNYNKLEIEDAVKKINLVLENDSLREKMTINARQAVVKEHTWDNRAEKIINLFL